MFQQRMSGLHSCLLIQQELPVKMQPLIASFALPSRYCVLYSHFNLPRKLVVIAYFYLSSIPKSLSKIPYNCPRTSSHLAVSHWIRLEDGRERA